MAAWLSERRKKTGHSILLGDFNIAPLENDVWSHKQLLSVVSHTPIEIAALETLAESQNWIDAVRLFFPESEKLYSWWSYRAKEWAISNKGRRLDHIWVTPLLEEFLQSAAIVRDIRGWTRPSDHAPVLIELMC
jgi:exodeoxyribonuclease-3